jgi:hypothetical protein
MTSTQRANLMRNIEFHLNVLLAEAERLYGPRDATYRFAGARGLKTRLYKYGTLSDRCLAHSSVTPTLPKPMDKWTNAHAIRGLAPIAH